MKDYILSIFWYVAGIYIMKNTMVSGAKLPMGEKRKSEKKKEENYIKTGERALKMHRFGSMLAETALF